MEAIKRRTSRRSSSSKIPKNLQCSDPGLSQYYYSRRSSSVISTNDLPLELDAIGFSSPWAVLWFCCFMVAPLAYIYIALMLLRDLCIYFPETVYQTLQTHMPYVAQLADLMNNSSRLMDGWCVIEGLFFIACKLKFKYLQRIDPLEASLSAAPMMDPEDRKVLWERMVEVEQDDVVSFISGWFFDEPIESISRYDVCDFICWSIFDGRNQEHLTTEELHDLECFLESLEYHISLKLYGAKPESEEEVEPDKENQLGKPKDRSERPALQKIPQPYEEDETASSTSDFTSSAGTRRPRPQKIFKFSTDTQHEQPTYFSNMYESYRDRYDRYRNMVENADFHPMQDFRQRLAETAHQAEESAIATAHSMYETIVQPGSSVDKQLSALSHATSAQITEAWNSVKGMKERIETATFLSEQRNALMQQLRGNRAMLTRMREMSYAVPSSQMAALMRRITECYDALEIVEHRAKEGFVQWAGRGTSIFARKEPQRYAKYSSDPLLGIVTYPLGLHMLVLGGTEIPLRIMMKNRGFERRCVGPVAYYYHPGKHDENEMPNRNFASSSEQVPIVFVHGIGIGIIAYMPLVDDLLKTGKPMLLPEIPFVSGFRPWQSSNSVLSPAVVASTMTAMLATHGFSKGVFVGHSYGTTWLSYVCKFSPSSVAALLFLDPICFCLHYPRLTKNFVYHYPDPGTISFMVRTDMMINWTIQRAFPWSWISLFVEQVHVPCTVFLGGKDALVPTARVEKYFKSKDIPIIDAMSANQEFFDNSGDFNACIFRGEIHGAFTEDYSLLPPITLACRRLINTVEQQTQNIR